MANSSENSQYLPGGRFVDRHTGHVLGSCLEVDAPLMWALAATF